MRFVSASAGSDLNSGQCWADAYATLEKALGDLNNTGLSVVEIRIGQGTYQPAVDSSFEIRKGCTIRGGYRGNTSGGSANDWNPSLFVTTLDGDLGSDEYAAHLLAILVDEEPSEEFGDVLIEGLKFTGVIQSNDIQGGAAIWSGMVAEPWDSATFHGVITVSECEFFENTAVGNGGAIVTRKWDLRVRHSQFADNTVASAGGFGATYGGAIYAQLSALTVSNCRFERNQALGQSAHGGAIAVHKGMDSTTLGNAIFIENVAEGSVEGTGGGAVAFDTEGEGGPLLMNCVFQANSAFKYGGAILSPHPTEIHSCTFEGNDAGLVGGGFYSADDVGATLVNSIFWNNTCGTPTEDVEEQIAPLHTSLEAAFVISHCCIKDLNTGTSATATFPVIHASTTLRAVT